MHFYEQKYVKYHENGYLDIPEILKCPKPFLFVTGGRGTGKTFGALKYVLESGTRFMMMRRRQEEADIISKPEYSPFKKINMELGYDIQPKKISKQAGAFINMDTSEIVGYFCALSTIATLRGFDASDVDLIIYDEFIPEEHKVPIKAEGKAFLNAIETINRNRELDGLPPARVLALSNSERLDNELFHGLNLIRPIEQMKEAGCSELVVDDRGYAVFLLKDSPISERKAQTALYKFAAGTGFSDMALSNEFADYNDRRTASVQLREYVPVASVDGLFIYRHKSSRKYHVTQSAGGTFKTIYSGSDADKLAFVRRYPLLYDYYLQHKVTFSDYDTEAKFLRLY